MTPDIRVCSNCIMDTTDAEIVFDEHGVCNHCRTLRPVIDNLRKSEERVDRMLSSAAARIRAAGRGRPYDCILGLSGGMDSTYSASFCKKYGLRTLLVHMDNGWDLELAVRNIEKIIAATGFEYFNHVIDWEEFRDLQRAYFKASVIDIEVVTDHCLRALAFQLAERFRIPVILRGWNPSTESLMPRTWAYQKNDLANLLAIHRKFGTVPIRTYPTMGMYKLEYYKAVRGIREESFLANWVVDVARTREVIRRDFDWQDPGGKHYESIFTRFYQGYILPRKWNVDKRKAHYSNLILSDNLTRAEALERMKLPPYPAEKLRDDYDYAIKKLGFTREEFEEIMTCPPVPHAAFPTDRMTWAQKAYLPVRALPRRIRLKFGGK